MIFSRSMPLLEQMTIKPHLLSGYGKEQFPHVIHCLLYLSKMKAQPLENGIILVIDVAKFLHGLVFFGTLQCGTISNECFKNMPSVTHPKSAIHQNSYSGTAPLAVATTTLNVARTPFVQFSSNLVNEAHTKISLINL